MFPALLYSPFLYPREGWGAQGVPLPQPGSTMFTPAYWPPRYFAAAYFSGAGTAAAAPIRDRDIFRAIKAALEATGAFETVVLHQGPDRCRTAANQNPVCTLRRTGWSEVVLHDPPLIERTVTYQLAIAYREQDEIDRFEAIELLEEQALNALDGQSLSGLCLAFKTVLERGADDPQVRHPEQRIVLEGRFAYLIPGYSGRNSSQ